MPIRAEQSAAVLWGDLARTLLHQFFLSVRLVLQVFWSEVEVDGLCVKADGRLVPEFGDVHEFGLVLVDFPELVHLLQHLLVEVLLPFHRFLLLLAGGQMVEGKALWLWSTATLAGMCALFQWDGTSGMRGLPMRQDCSFPDALEGRRTDELFGVQQCLLRRLPLVITSLLFIGRVSDDFEHLGGESLPEIAEVGLPEFPLGVKLDVEVVQGLAVGDVVVRGRVVLGIDAEVGVEAAFPLRPLLLGPHLINIMPPRQPKAQWLGMRMDGDQGCWSVRSRTASTMKWSQGWFMWGMKSLFLFCPLPSPSTSPVQQWSWRMGMLEMIWSMHFSARRLVFLACTCRMVRFFLVVRIKGCLGKMCSDVCIARTRSSPAKFPPCAYFTNANSPSTFSFSPMTMCELQSPAKTSLQSRTSSQQMKMPSSCTCSLFLGYLEERCRLPKMKGLLGGWSCWRRLLLKPKVVRMKASVQNSSPFCSSSFRYSSITSRSFFLGSSAARLRPQARKGLVQSATHASNSPFMGFISSEKISSRVASLQAWKVYALTSPSIFFRMRWAVGALKWSLMTLASCCCSRCKLSESLKAR